MKIPALKLVGDFETTVYEGQKSTEVWASALVEFHSENVKIFGSIEETWEYLKSLHQNLIVYYHNLKFDGEFWMNYFLRIKKYRPALIEGRWKTKKELMNNEYMYSISSRGQWYKILIKVGGRIIEFRDSLKLLPFSVKQLGKSFGTKHRKMTMEYTGYRHAGCYISDKEREYIANDVLVVKEALEIMEAEGHTDLTIGSACMREFKSAFHKTVYDELFPNLDKYEISTPTGDTTIWEYIRKSYRGGWTYLVPGKAQRVLKNGLTADVNSLYPYVMHSASGNFYPVGLPQYYKGAPMEDWDKDNGRYYFLRVKLKFEIKDGYLPFIQIKGNPFYKGTECLTSSDFTIKDKKYSKITLEGETIEAKPELTFTKSDWQLVREHYNLYEIEYIDCLLFRTEIGIFDSYIDKYKKIKMTSKGAKRTEAKLFSNNLYGKTATNKDSSFKEITLDPYGAAHFEIHPEYDKTPGYIPVGSAITSNARCYTIRKAQKNFHGADKPGFAYADTDSLHCDCGLEDLIDIPQDPYEYGCFKIESLWDEGFFTRQKTYIEHVTHEDLKEVKSHYDVKCAGMPDRCKGYFVKTMVRKNYKRGRKFEMFHVKHASPEVCEFLRKRHKITDFVPGLEVPGKLYVKHLPGGIVLVPGPYKMTKSYLVI